MISYHGTISLYFRMVSEICQKNTVDFGLLTILCGGTITSNNAVGLLVGF